MSLWQLVASIRALPEDSATVLARNNGWTTERRFLAYVHDQVAWLRWQWLSMNLSGSLKRGKPPATGSPKATHDATQPVLLLPQPDDPEDRDFDPASVDALKAFLT